MQHKNLYLFSEDLDLRIQCMLEQVTNQQDKLLKYELWYEEEMRYKREKDSFLRNLAVFKEKLLATLNQYLANRNPNRHSRQLFTQLYTAIQSMKDIETGEVTYDKVCALFCPHGYDEDRGSPTLCKYSKKIENQLAYYFQQDVGVCMKNKVKHLLWCEKDRVNERRALNQDKIKTFVIQCFSNKYDEILEKNPPLKETLKKLDVVSSLIDQFCHARTEYRTSDHFKYFGDAITPDLFEEKMRKHYSKEAQRYNNDSVRGLPKHVLKRIAEDLRKIDYNIYISAQKKQYEAKKSVLHAITSFSHSPSIVVVKDVPEKTGDSDINQAFHSLIEQMQKRLTQKHSGLVETYPHEIGKRLSILLDKQAYSTFINECCARLRAQFGVPHIETHGEKWQFLSDEEKQTTQPPYARMHCTMFKLTGNQPAFPVPRCAVEEGGAIGFFYGEKAL